ncbi:MAG: hypothetical protein FWH11_05130 [Micrococcales bacterium]|nr:hypothetical protein [Micrococcales bacterium]
MLSGAVLSQWLQRQTGTVVQGSRITLSLSGLPRISQSVDSVPVRPRLPVVHGGQAAVARVQDETGAELALRVQGVASQEEQSRHMERLVSMLTVATAAREQPQTYPAVLPVHESFVLTVPGTQIPVTDAAEEYELWCDVMAWCPGDLNDWLASPATLRTSAAPPRGASRAGEPVQHRPAEVVLPLFLPVIATVQAVHENLGIIHRDITPNNVMVDSTGRLLLADWGIAHGLAAGQTSTYTQLVGNRGFALPPEMLAGDPSVGRYTDAWYLGCLLSWMLTGDTPGPQHGPGWLPPGLPEGQTGDVVRAVVGGLCAADPHQRLALPDAVAALREGRAPTTTVELSAPATSGLPGRASGSPGSGEPAGSVTEVPVPVAVPARSRRRVLVVVALVVAGCLVLGGTALALVGYALRDDAKSPPAGPPTTSQPDPGPTSDDRWDFSIPRTYVVWDSTGPFSVDETLFRQDYAFTSEDRLPRQITCDLSEVMPNIKIDLDALVLTADVEVAIEVGPRCTLIVDIPPETNWTLDWNGIRSYTTEPSFEVIGSDFAEGPVTLGDGPGTYRHVPNPGQPVLHLTVSSMFRFFVRSSYVQWDYGTAAFEIPVSESMSRFRFPSDDELPREITCVGSFMTSLDFRHVSLSADVDVTIDYAKECPTNTLLLSPDQNWTVDWSGTGSAALKVAPGVADASGQTVKAGTKTLSHVVDPGKPTLNLKVTSASVVHVEPQQAVY